jgi:hypothetical protein
MASTFEYAPFRYDRYEESDKVEAARKKASDAEAAVEKYGDFVWGKQGEYDNLFKEYQTRPDFSYDFNADALYQQYKDKYIQQGKMAMADTIGQASAMTGGYGNSYAQSVGNQAYQASLQNLNDIIPELYQMAYDRYNQKGQDMLNMLGLLGNERDFAYGQYADGYNRLVSDRDYYGNRYDSERTWDYGVYSDDRTLAHSEHTNKQNLAYDLHRDAIEDAQWQADFNEAKRQYDESLAFQKQKYEDSKSSYSNDFSSDDPDDNPDDNNDSVVVEPEDNSYQAVNSKNVSNFQSGIRTRNEFYGRSSAEKEKYKTYKAYIEGKLDEWLTAGRLNDEEVATLIAYYGV